MKFQTRQFGDKAKSGDILVWHGELRLYGERILIQLFSHSQKIRTEEHFGGLVMGVSARSTFCKSPSTNNDEK